MTDLTHLIKYENYPTNEMVEEAGLTQLVSWINWLPSPLTVAEECIYNKVIDQRDTFFALNLNYKGA